MVKMIGVLLVLSSFLAMAAGAFIDLKYGSEAKITGNVVSDIIAHSDVELGFPDYASASAFSYSILSLIMGIVFLARV
ncbi:hypothetical protein HY487_01880 [Candidatus Woesearchaeota archaeon]|nr:hypothetical protein [Candidatus Woesearchaeota archaeon]